MPRIARKTGITGIYHVIFRGNNKETLFTEHKDYLRFLRILLKYKQESGYSVLAYCLMSNHVHLLIKTVEEPLGGIMQKILISYSHYFNKKYERTGHVYESRFSSRPVDDEAYLVNVFRYIHNNPVKAGMVCKPQDYRWSSYGAYHGIEDEITDTAEITALFPKLSDLLLQQDEFTDAENQIILPRIVYTDSEVHSMVEMLTDCKTPDECRALPKKERDECIRELRRRKIPVRQISRMMGISKSRVGLVH